MEMGVPNALFWDLTSRELEEIFKSRAATEKRTNLLFGLVAATVVNVNRKKGAPLTKPSDFFKEKPKPEDFMDVAEAERVLGLWAAATVNSKEGSN